MIAFERRLREQCENNAPAAYISKTPPLRFPQGTKPHISEYAASFPSAGGVAGAERRSGWVGHICFTEMDQAFLLWGTITLFIFSLGQFSPLSWTTQAILDAALTGTGIATTSGLTWVLACSAKLRWVIFLWAGLMSAGTVATVYGIFYGNVLILSNLCLLWLGLCTLGYGAMGLGMRSRSFTAVFWVHLGAMFYLSYAPGWQFFNSGLVMASTLFFFSVVPWDMQTCDRDIPQRID